MYELLLKNGTEIDAQDNKGLSPLMLAGQKGLTDTVRVLLKAGANAQLRNKNGQTALDLAATDEIKQLIEWHLKGHSFDKSIYGSKPGY